MDIEAFITGFYLLHSESYFICSVCQLVIEGGCKAVEKFSQVFVTWQVTSWNQGLMNSPGTNYAKVQALVVFIFLSQLGCDIWISFTVCFSWAELLGWKYFPFRFASFEDACSMPRAKLCCNGKRLWFTHTHSHTVFLMKSKYCLPQITATLTWSQAVYEAENVHPSLKCCKCKSLAASELTLTH